MTPVGAASTLRRAASTSGARAGARRFHGDPMLEIDLRGKLAFVAGVGDDRGYGWAIVQKRGPL